MSAVALGWLQGCVLACSCTSLTGVEATKAAPAAAAAAASAATAAAVAAAAASGVDLSKGLGAGFRCQLLMFPKNHLDFSSLVASYTLSRVPLAMDCTEQHVLVASAPLQLLLLQLEGGSSSSPARPAGSSAAANSNSRRLVAVRELSMFNVGRPVCDVALVSPAMTAEQLHRRPGTSGSSSGRALAAAGSSNSNSCQAVLLRWGGLMSVLDLSRGTELMLSDEIESFWLSDMLPVLPGAAAGSSRAGSTSASASHSRTSSMQNLSAIAGSNGNTEAATTASQQLVTHIGAAAAVGVSSGDLHGPFAAPGNGNSNVMSLAAEGEGKRHDRDLSSAIPHPQ